jgi:hypothetical protein
MLRIHIRRDDVVEYFNTSHVLLLLLLLLQDFLTCAFLVTSRDKFLTRSQFSQLCAAMGDGLDEVGTDGLIAGGRGEGGGTTGGGVLYV